MTIDKAERYLRPEDGVLAPAHLCRRLKNRNSRLLDTKLDDFTRLNHLHVGVLRESRQTTHTDVVQPITGGANAHPRNDVGKKSTRVITRRAISDLATDSPLQLLIRKHECPLAPRGPTSPS